jgi:glyoxylase-like metal-dependent hydrolase (beta-lactamase superfamily II)
MPRFSKRSQLFRKQKKNGDLMAKRNRQYWLIIVVFLFFVSFPSVLCAQTAQTYIDSAVAAIGGREALLGLKSQRIISHGENFEPEQAVQPGGEPRKVSTFTCVLLRDLITGKVRYDWQRDIPPPVSTTWKYTEIINGDEGAIIGADGGRSPAQRPSSAARVAARRKELSRAAASVFVNALSRSSSFLRLMDQVIRGRKHYVVSYDNQGQQVIMALDGDTRLLTKVEFLEDDPIYGDTQNELFFSDWRQVGVLKLPFELLYRVNGQEVMVEHIDSIENDVELKPEDFTIPEVLAQVDQNDGRRGDFSSQWLLRRVALGSPLDDEQTRVELAEVGKGVWHITGGTHHSMVIEMKDHLVVVEAPLYEERSQAVLAELARKFPGKSVRSVVTTHFHNDHSGGLRAYVAVGASVVTGKVNETFFQTVFSASHSRMPDSLQRQMKPAVIETVETEKKTLTDGERSIEVYPVNTSHSAGMLVVYLPKEKLLFVSDLFSPGAPRQIAAFCRELLEAIQHYNLQVVGIVGGHGNKIGALADLRQAATAQ